MRFWIGIGVCWVVVTLLLSAKTETTTRWTYTACYTNSCIADTLNRLDPERAAEAKLTTWKDQTYVWYREQ